MSLIDKFSIKDTVSFEVYPAAILGSNFKNVKVVGILDADSARGWIDPQALHANVYATLPEGVPNHYDSYSYLKIKFPSGEYSCVGMPWIKEESMQVLESTSVQITIDNVAPEMHSRIVQQLSALGLSGIDLKVL